MIGLLATALAVVSGAGGLASVAHAASRRTPTLSASATVIAGPTSGITALTQLSIARDGTGGMAYVQTVGGASHVFVSRLLGGTFQPPIQVDTGLATPSSQPVIAAGNGGALVVGFISGGSLYVAQTTSSQSPLGPPSFLLFGAANPTISMSNFGKAYLAFTDLAGTPAQVDYAFYYAGQWALGSPVNANPAEKAGTGKNRPAVVTSGDGLGIVAWGEDGHVYARRLDGASPSTIYQQVDPPSFDGLGEVSASDPAISSGGNSSYASVAFTEVLANGSVPQSRVLVDQVVAGSSGGVFAADGLVAGDLEGADQPATAVTEYGAGWVTAELDQSHELWAANLGPNAQFEGVGRVDSSPNTGDPDAVPATAGLFSTLIAWQQTPGIAGPAEIRERYAPDGYDLSPETVVSSPSLGATDADTGLVAAGDVAGDAAIAWAQGAGADQSIVAAQLYQAPGGFAPRLKFRYADSSQPILSWTPAAESWGPVRYTVSIDGLPVTTTYGTAIRPPAAVADGRHAWEVTATNRAGLSTTGAVTVVFIDTRAPRVHIRASGRRVVGLPERVSVTESDRPPPGLSRRAASGIVTTGIRWGDGSHGRLRRSAVHVYRRPGRYTVKVVVTDRAGNRTEVEHTIRIRRPGSRAHRRHRKRR